MTFYDGEYRADKRVSADESRHRSQSREAHSSLRHAKRQRMQLRMRPVTKSDSPNNNRGFSMRLVAIYATALGGILGAVGSSQAQPIDFGEWKGQVHDIPAAHCANQGCKILGGGNVEGDYIVIPPEDFPTDIYLDTKAVRVDCFGQDCVFDDQRTISIDNLHHKVYVSVLSHSGAVKVQAVAHIAGPAPGK
jgi:hypothetical protein